MATNNPIREVFQNQSRGTFSKPTRHPQSALREQPLSFSLAHHAPAMLPTVLNLPGSLTSWGLLHLLFLLPEIFSSFRHQFKHHLLRTTLSDHASPSASHTRCPSPVVFPFAFFTVRKDLAYLLSTTSCKGSKKQGFKNCSLPYPQCLEHSPMHSRH